MGSVPNVILPFPCMFVNDDDLGEVPAGILAMTRIIMPDPDAGQLT